VTFAGGGIAIHGGEDAVAELSAKLSRPERPEVLNHLSGFAGLFQLNLKGYTEPILAASTDGVGTKLTIAQQLDIHDTIGIDLVAMVADDLVASGAEPLFLTSYIACGEVLPDRVAAIGVGISDGCHIVGCALLGGETAAHPGILRPDEYDLSATGVGLVDRSRLLNFERVEAGDVIVAMRSSGLHANGYTQVRNILLAPSRMRLDTVVEEFGNHRTLGQELLTPTRIYARDCLDLVTECDVHAFAHITGGGILGNVERILPEHLDAVINRATWRPQPIFDLVRARGRVETIEMESTFNMGVGMMAVVPPADADRALAFLSGRGVEAWLIGEIIEGRGMVQMVGAHTRG
jgi:phosphoribosylformylglycinamidine cyclo-ligase